MLAHCRLLQPPPLDPLPHTEEVSSPPSTAGYHEKNQDCEVYAHSGPGKGSVRGLLSL